MKGYLKSSDVQLKRLETKQMTHTHTWEICVVYFEACDPPNFNLPYIDFPHIHSEYGFSLFYSQPNCAHFMSVDKQTNLQKTEKINWHKKRSYNTPPESFISKSMGFSFQVFWPHLCEVKLSLSLRHYLPSCLLSSSLSPIFSISN